MSRPQRPYHSTCEGPIVGLARGRDGRWRILATGERFRESDERRAIERFRRGTTVEDAIVHIPPTGSDLWTNAQVGALLNRRDGIGENLKLLRRHVIGTSVKEAALWAWLRDQLIEQPEWVALKVGIPELAGLRRFSLPKSPLNFQAIIAAYEATSSGSVKSRRECVASFKRLVAFTGGTTLDRLTDEVLVAFRASVIADPKLSSSETIAVYFSRIRNVLRLASRSDLDVSQLDAALVRCKAKLFPPPSTAVSDPHPIRRADFHALLDAAARSTTPELWRAILLLGLNAAMYMEDLCDLRWSNLDLPNGTLIARRKKRGLCLRVATLWECTVEAIRNVPRRGSSDFVFVSKHGTRYNRNTKINDFAELAKKADVVGVTFSHLRDGAYTAACHAPEVDERFARLLAGHKAPGLQDRYVLRNPCIVRPACDAVFGFYLGAR